MDELERCQTENKKLKAENDELNDDLMEVTWELNFNKQDELIEFVRELYSSLKDEENLKLSTVDLIHNLKTYIEQFAKNNSLNI